MSEFQPPNAKSDHGPGPFGEKAPLFLPQGQAAHPTVAPAEVTQSAAHAATAGNLASTAAKPAPQGSVVRALGQWADEKHDQAANKSSGFHPVVKGQYLHFSEMDPAVIGLQFQGQWLVAVSGGKPAPLASASVGALRVVKDVAIVEMQVATPSDGGWKLQGAPAGHLIQGTAEAPTAVGEIGRKAGGGWRLHGQHGSKDKLPADLEAALQDDDQVELKGMNASAVWMTYPVGTEKENPGGWASTGHSKSQVGDRIAAFKKDASNLPEPLRAEVLRHIEAIAVVSTIEGSYAATSGQVGDCSGSLGIFQWARNRSRMQLPIPLIISSLA